MICLPTEFERRDISRLFSRKLQAGGHTPSEAVLCAYQVWSEWATSAVEWRPLRHRVDDLHSHEWGHEDLTHIIESYCVGFHGEVGKLILAALESGFMALERRDDMDGITLAGFWALNKHLSPDYLTIQQLGGKAKAAKHAAKQALQLGEQRAALFDQQGIFLFGSEKPTKEEQNQVYALIIRMDRASGKTQRLTRDYTESLTRDALQIVRKFSPDDILAVETYIVENRENPAVVKDADRIIQSFASILEAATR
jgi:hypothetical protein